MMEKLSKFFTALCCFILVLANTGCNTGKKVNENNNKEDIAEYETVKNGTFRNLNQEKEGGLLQGTNTNYLLYGYNVLKYGYIDDHNIDKKFAIIDSAKLTADDYELVDAFDSKGKYMYSNKVSDFYSSLNVSASAKYKGVMFSGSIEAEYGISSKITEEQRLIKYMQFHTTYEQYYKVTPNRIKQMLSANFLSDIGKYAKTDPGKIFELYGTHLITQYYLGGRAELNFLFTSYSSETEQEIKTSASASYLRFSGKASADDIKKSKLVMDNSEMSFESKGGSNISGISPEDISAKYDKWVESIKDSPGICSIGEFDKSMLPIWELIDDKDAADKLEEEFKKQAETSESELLKLDPKAVYITEIAVYAHKDNQTALSQIPSGYKKVLLNPATNGNTVLEANKGAKGDYIYLAYKTGDKKSEAITDIRLSYAKKKSDAKTPAGYIKVDVDLNKGAKGYYIYLCYKKGNAGENTLVPKEIRGVYAESYTLPVGWEWPSNNVDLNKGSGGEWIYLAIRKGL